MGRLLLSSFPPLLPPFLRGLCLASFDLNPPLGCSCRPVAPHAGADDRGRHGDAPRPQQGLQGEPPPPSCREGAVLTHALLVCARASGRRWRSWSTGGRWRTWRRSSWPETSASEASSARTPSPPASSGTGPPPPPPGDFSKASPVPLPENRLIGGDFSISTGFPRGRG